MFKKLIILLIITSSLYPVDKTGTTAAKFLSIGAGAKAVSMGGAFTSIANDPSAMYWNPAGIATLKSNALLVNHTNWLADISYDYVGVVIQTTPSTTFGVNLTAITMGEMEITRYDNENTGETFKAASWAFGVTFATRLTDRFSIGFNGKLLREIIANESASGIAMDVGTLFDTPFGFRLGASISNFGPKMQMDGPDLLYPINLLPNMHGDNESVVGEIATDKFDLPLILRVGVSDDIAVGNIGRITWAIDANHPNDNTEYVNVGIEIALLNEMVFIRGGSKGIYMKDREEDYTVGMGINYPISGISNLTVDYAFELMNHLGNVHKFTLGISF
jgi:hypothetical protein